MYGKAPRPVSSFGGLLILLAIHIMIRNMAQYAGILETLPTQVPNTFSKRSQLGSALNGLRSLLPKKTEQNKKTFKRYVGLVCCDMEPCIYTFTYP